MPIFTVQQHAARALHYDFRLEVDNVLRSWAVPKGPSTDPAEKRLAVEVEDHEMGYADFEGRHGPGYGAGAVIVWDMGEYRPLTEGDFGAALDAGHASFWLEGRKLHGGWTLQRTDAGRKPQWLLIKKRDEHAGDPLEPESILSGRTIDEL
jgi:DNA ligase D-like protein (predicted 3'-phosphoesterase)